MDIKRAKSSGFCFGVKHAVETAQNIIKDKDNYSDYKALVMLGELTHNEEVVRELVEGGFTVIDKAQDVPEGSLVLIRAHGVPPTEIKILEDKKCEVIDCTCPFVAKIHKIVSKAASEGKNIIITGTKGHPEVIGIKGQAEDKGVKVAVISSVSDLENIEFPLEGSILVSQTTFSSYIFKNICAIVENKIENFLVFDTICSTTENRQKEAAMLAEQSDLMLVIGSAKSSNTNKLFDICKGCCDRTYLIRGLSDLKELMSNGLINSNDRIGITAGASTPEVIILEVLQTMSENEKDIMTNQEQADINFGDYIESIPQIRRNAVVKGAITSADADYVYVDVHDKSEGKIPLKEFAGDVDFDLDKAIAEHQEITVVVKSIRNSDQGKEILLSKSQLDYEKNKTALEEAYNSKTPITVKITKTVKDGLIGNFGGIDVYIHRTQIKFGNVDNLDEYVGQTLEVRVTKFDTDKHRLRISGSRRIILADERKAKSDEVWNAIEEGKHYTGIVRSLPDFGAFVDIGGVDGLVHVSELSWTRIKKPSDVLSVGDEIDVYVKSFDPETKKISLGYKKEEDNPFYKIEERIPVGAVIQGKVVRITTFGAFVNLEPNLDALCHISQISDERLEKVSDVLSVGQEVQAKVLSIDPEAEKISISIKAVAPINPEHTEEESITEEAEATEE